MVCTHCVERLRKIALDAETAHKADPADNAKWTAFRTAWEGYWAARDELWRQDIEARYPITEEAA